MKLSALFNLALIALISLPVGLNGNNDNLAQELLKKPDSFWHTLHLLPKTIIGSLFLKYDPIVPFILKNMSVKRRTLTVTAFSALGSNESGDLVITGDMKGTVKIWDSVTSDLLKTFANPGSFVTSVVMNKAGNLLLTGSFNGTVTLWNVETQKAVKSFKGNSDMIRSAVFSPDELSVLAVFYDNTAKIWDIDSGNLRASYGDVLSATFTPDASEIVTLSHDSITYRDTKTGKILSTRTFDNINLQFAEFNAQENTILLVDQQNDMVKIINAANGQVTNSFKGSRVFEGIMDAKFWPRENLILMKTERKLALWDPATGYVVRFFSQHDDIENFTFNSIGNTLVVSTMDRHIDLDPPYYIDLIELSSFNEIYRYFKRNDSITPVQALLLNQIYDAVLCNRLESRTINNSAEKICVFDFSNYPYLEKYYNQLPQIVRNTLAGYVKTTSNT